MTRSKVCAEAARWLGTPYHHRARLQGHGVDCVQILCAVYQAVGVWAAEVEPGEYPTDWHLHRSEEMYLQRLAAHAKPTDSPRPGDIAVFGYGRTMSHGGIVTDGGVIHAYIGLGVILTRLDEAPLSGRPVLYFNPMGD